MYIYSSNLITSHSKRSCFVAYIWEMFHSIQAINFIPLLCFARSLISTASYEIEQQKGGDTKSYSVCSYKIITVDMMINEDIDIDHDYNILRDLN